MEKLRKAVRGVIGYNSPVYRAGAQITNFIKVVGAEGPESWRTLKALAAKHGSEQVSLPPVLLKLRKLDYPIFLRPGTEDATTVISTVVREEYGQFRPAAAPRVMIDAGAYIGDTSAYFLSRFKNLDVIALEPSRSTFEAAKVNLMPYGQRVRLLNQGLAAAPGQLRFCGTNTGASLSDEGTEIYCTSISELMSRFGLERIDILKMDIEGAEEEIFKAEPEQWLPRVDNVLIELHGPGCERTVLGALKQAGFGIKQHRSVYYCTRRS